MNIYVGNLPYDTTEQQLVDAFKIYGVVDRATLVFDRETGRPRGFGFVEMPNDSEGREAIEKMAGNDFHGRPLTVNEARPRAAGANTSRQDDLREDRPAASETEPAVTSRGYTNTVLSRKQEAEVEEDEEQVEVADEAAPKDAPSGYTNIRRDD
ncbi:RNA recognition motif domain-containing protein [Mucisphaera sp.]|uniref:RNA recognition motif domain-containing protein n=1 Tax=Mucisphaera sp. TaxID=2913024 RepID=UPI003D0F2331